MSEPDPTRVAVCVRIRPKLESQGEQYELELIKKISEDEVQATGYVQGMVDSKTSKSYQFDHVFDEGEHQTEIYERAAKPFVDAALRGINATIFAYGQTGTGKTFTIGELPDEVEENHPMPENAGISVRALYEIFQYKVAQQKNMNVRLLVSYLEIYNETIRDLLNPSKEGENLQMRERGDEVEVVDLTTYEVEKLSQIFAILKKGNRSRATFSTKMNDRSSRSHAVFLLTIEQWIGDKLGTASTLTLVDLAGSERIKKSQAEGQRQKEALAINKSLSALGNVINAMFFERAHVPYRDSKLTRILKNSFVGNCRTLLIATLAPTAMNYGESLSTLHFADRVKQLKPRSRALVSHELELRVLTLEKDLREVSAELRIAKEAWGYEFQLDDLDAADMQFDEKVAKRLDRVQKQRAKEEEARQQDIADRQSRAVAKERETCEAEKAAALGDAKATHERIVTDLERRLEAVQGDKSTAEATVASLQQKIAAHEETIASLTRSTRVAETKIATLMGDLETAQKQRRELEDSLSSSNAQAAQVVTLQRQVQDEQAETAKVRQALTEAQTQLELERQTVAQKKREIATLRTDLQRARDEAAEAAARKPSSPAAAGAAAAAASSSSAAAAFDVAEEQRQRRARDALMSMSSVDNSFGVLAGSPHNESADEMRMAIKQLRERLDAVERERDHFQRLAAESGGESNLPPMGGGNNTSLNGSGMDGSVDGAEGDLDAAELVAQVIKYLQNGTQLLKHGRQGKPHTRFFYFSEDLRYLVWKDNERATRGKMIDMQTVSRCVLGQHTEVFNRQKSVPTKYQRDCSFSLYYAEGGQVRTLDVVSENTMEWEAWVMAMSHILRDRNILPEYGAPIDWRTAPRYSELGDKDRSFCARFHVSPRDFLAIKEKAVLEFSSLGDNMVMAIRGVWSEDHIDYYRASALFQYLKDSGALPA